MTFLGFLIVFLFCALPLTRYKSCRMRFGGLTVSSLGVNPYRQTMYFSDGLDPICRTMRWPGLSHSSADELFERFCL